MLAEADESQVIESTLNSSFLPWIMTRCYRPQLNFNVVWTSTVMRRWMEWRTMMTMTITTMQIPKAVVLFSMIDCILNLFMKTCAVIEMKEFKSLTEPGCWGVCGGSLSFVLIFWRRKRFYLAACTFSNLFSLCYNLYNLYEPLYLYLYSDIHVFHSLKVEPKSELCCV